MTPDAARVDASASKARNKAAKRMQTLVIPPKPRFNQLTKVGTAPVAISPIMTPRVPPFYGKLVPPIG